MWRIYHSERGVLRLKMIITPNNAPATVSRCVNFSLFCFFAIPKNNAFIANLFALPRKIITFVLVICFLFNVFEDPACL
jgi:hypothetical protein